MEAIGSAIGCGGGSPGSGATEDAIQAATGKCRSGGPCEAIGAITSYITQPCHGHRRQAGSSSRRLSALASRRNMMVMYKAESAVGTGVEETAVLIPVPLAAAWEAVVSAPCTPQNK